MLESNQSQNWDGWSDCGGLKSKDKVFLLGPAEMEGTLYKECMYGYTERLTDFKV